MQIKIRKVPAFIIKLKILPGNISVALAPYVFLCESLWEEYEEGRMSCVTEAIIAHESTHIRREQAMGLLKFLFLYLTSKKFCFDEEIEAIKEEMKVYKTRGQEFDVKRRAYVLSTYGIYHHCTSYEDARKALDALWHQT